MGLRGVDRVCEGQGQGKEEKLSRRNERGPLNEQVDDEQTDPRREHGARESDGPLHAEEHEISTASNQVIADDSPHGGRVDTEHLSSKDDDQQAEERSSKRDADDDAERRGSHRLHQRQVAEDQVAPQHDDGHDVRCRRGKQRHVFHARERLAVAQPQRPNGPQQEVHVAAHAGDGEVHDELHQEDAEVAKEPDSPDRRVAEHLDRGLKEEASQEQQVEPGRGRKRTQHFGPVGATKLAVENGSDQNDERRRERPTCVPTCPRGDAIVDALPPILKRSNPRLHALGRRRRLGLGARLLAHAAVMPHRRTSRKDAHASASRSLKTGSAHSMRR